MADIGLTVDEIAREIGMQVLQRLTAEKRLRALQEQMPKPAAEDTTATD